MSPILLHIFLSWPLGRPALQRMILPALHHLAAVHVGLDEEGVDEGIVKTTNFTAKIFRVIADFSSASVPESIALRHPGR